MPEQADILTVTLNPAVDVATSVPQVIAGPKLRCGQPRFDPGGGGVNVARAIRKLGGTVQALIAVGGAMGERLLDLLKAEGVPTLPVPVSGETRQSFAVIDDSTAGQYRFSVPGHFLTEQDGARLIDAITAHTTKGCFLVLSGSVAPGLPVDFLSRIIVATATHAPRVIVDTSFAALNQLITRPTVPVHVLRVDQAEAEQAASHPMLSVADSVAFAADLVARGVAKTVVTGRGPEGSVMVSANHRFLCHPPVVPVRSKIGAGDAFVGALTLSLAQNEPPEKALQRGVSAASATVGTEGTALCDKIKAQQLFDQCWIEAL